MSWILSRFNELNKGSVCALYLLLVIILIHFFCNLNNRDTLYPQARRPYVNFEMIKL